MKTGKTGYRTNYKLKERLIELPAILFTDIFQTLTYEDGEYAISRRRWGQIINDELSRLYDFEVAVLCEKIGCTIFEIMDPKVDLEAIYKSRKKKEKQATLELFKAAS